MQTKKFEEALGDGAIGDNDALGGTPRPKKGGM
jgi:hypothetical protein